MTPAPDPLLDELREIRRRICDEAGNDVTRLAERLREVEADYRDRKGAFADVPRTPAGDVFPEAATPAPDPLLDDVRRLREER